MLKENEEFCSVHCPHSDLPFAKDFNVGTRIYVFDSRKFIDDVKTPLTVTMRPATIIRWRGIYDKSEMVDVIFDGETEISGRHIVSKNHLVME